LSNNKHVTWKSNEDLLVEAQSSIEIKQTTKGINFTVKVYDADPYNALKTATELFDKCKKRYTGDNNDKY